MRKKFLSLFGFGLATLATPIASLLAIPLVIAVAGPSAWSSLAVGQATGSLAAVLVALGWAVSGPAIVASTPVQFRPAVALKSLKQRSLPAAGLLILVGLIAVFLSPSHSLAAALAALAIGLAGMDMSWYFVGQARSDRLLILDAVPKLLGTIAASVVILVTSSVEAFAACQLLGSAVAIGLSAVVACRGAKSRGPYLGRSALGRGTQWQGSAVSVLSAVYLSLPTLLVAALAPSWIATYALAERIARALGLATTPFIQVLQGNFHSHDRSVMMQRAKVAFHVSAVACVVLSGAVLLGGPFASSLLSSGAITLNPLFILFLAAAVGAGTLSRFLGVVLIQFGHMRYVLLSVAIGAAVAAVGVAIGIQVDLARGAMAAVAVSEAVVATVQFVAILVVLRRRSSFAGRAVSLPLTESGVS